MTTAVVVGSGPNGLGAAVALARAGVEVTVLEAAPTIGGGTRTSELTLPGLLHDHCSATHPMGVASPFLRRLDLEGAGVGWRWADVDVAHPLGDGRCAAQFRSLSETRDRLGPDGTEWARLFGPLSEHLDHILADVMKPLVHVPHQPVALARFGLRALQPANRLVERWTTDETRALFAGAAAHSWHPFHRPTSAAVALLLVAAGHRHGWPVPTGGSRRITDALAAIALQHGARIETDAPVTRLDQLPPSDLVMLDLVPRGVVEIAGDRLPPRVRRAYQRFNRAPAAYKVDLAVEGGIPWSDSYSPRAGTVHVGGRFEDIAQAVQDVNRGRMPERPFVIVGQQYLADPQRSRDGVHPIWSYAQVPAGFTGDATEHVLAQIERYAPGARERVVAMTATPPARLEADNANYEGGDIIGGANNERQLLFRPRVTFHPYWTGMPGVYLCSAATPPGAGVHAMCGYNAAQSALRSLGLRSED